MRKIAAIILVFLIASVGRSENLYESNKYFPTIYLGISGNSNEDISSYEDIDYTYLLGSRWNLVKYFGLGLEYRQFQPNVNWGRREYKLDGNAAAMYLFFQSPKFVNCSVGLDSGGGVLWADNKDLDVGETWVASGRLNINYHITRFLDLTLWGGIFRIGEFSVQSGSRSSRSEQQSIYDAGIALRVHTGQIFK